MITFRALIETKYLGAGFTKTNALAAVTLGSGVCKSSAESAFEGRRVLPDTARDLGEWAMRVHKTEIDREALLMAAPRQPRSVEDLARRAQRAMEELLSASDLPREYGYLLEAAVDSRRGFLFRVSVVDTNILLARDEPVTNLSKDAAELPGALRNLRVTLEALSAANNARYG